MARGLKSYTEMAMVCVHRTSKWKFLTLGQIKYLIGFQKNLMPHLNETSNSLKTSGLRFLVIFKIIFHHFFIFFSLFFKFDFRNGLHMARGPQKGILLGWFIRGQVVLQWRPQFLIKWNLTWCIFLSLSEHVQCIYQLIRAIHDSMGTKLYSSISGGWRLFQPFFWAS